MVAGAGLIAHQPARDRHQCQIILTLDEPQKGCVCFGAKPSVEFEAHGDAISAAETGEVEEDWLVLLAQGWTQGMIPASIC